jgi:hypothetical protein
MERFNLKKLDEVEGKKLYWVETSNRFPALEKLDDDVDINRAWKTISENTKISAEESIGYYELKQLKMWFNQCCSILLDERKQDKLQWLQDPSQMNGDNFNNVRSEASRHFRNKMREYLKAKINELATHCKNKKTRHLYREVHEFKGYQPRGNLVKDENGYLIAEFHKILKKWKNYFSQLLNVHMVSDVRQIEIHTAEPIVLGPSPFGAEIAIAKIKTCKSSGSDQIPAKLIQTGG